MRPSLALMSVFVYGTLMAPEVLHALIVRVPEAVPGEEELSKGEEKEEDARARAPPSLPDAPTPRPLSPPPPPHSQPASPATAATP